MEKIYLKIYQYTYCISKMSNNPHEDLFDSEIRSFVDLCNTYVKLWDRQKVIIEIEDYEKYNVDDYNAFVYDSVIIKNDVKSLKLLKHPETWSKYQIEFIRILYGTMETRLRFMRMNLNKMFAHLMGFPL